MAWVSTPSGAWSWIWVGGWAAVVAEGCARASTSMGAASGVALGLGLGSCLASGLRSGLGGLGAGSAGGSASGWGLGLLAFLPTGAAFCDPNRSLRQHERHTTDASQPETSPFPLGLPPTVSPPPPLQQRSQPPGTHHPCRTHTPVKQTGGHVSHRPPKRGVPRAAVAAAAASPSPPFHDHGGARGPTMSCCPIRRTCASGLGAFWVARVLGGARQGVWVPRRGGGGGFAGEVLRGLPGVGGLNP